MRITGQYTGIHFDLSGYEQQLSDYLLNALHEGAKAWLQAVAGRGGRVPLWSGMARASLLELSELVDGRIVLSPQRARSRVSEGSSLGTAIQKISKSGAKVSIDIETNVPHYTLQEYRNVGVSPRAPWQSLLAGKLAFQLKTQDARLPKPLFRPLNMPVS
jgi:hypothetical protein